MKGKLQGWHLTETVGMMLPNPQLLERMDDMSGDVSVKMSEHVTGAEESIDDDGNITFHLTTSEAMSRWR